MKRWAIPIAITLILIVGAAYLGFQSSQPEASAATEAPPTVPVDRGDVQKTVTAPGKLIGTGEVVLSMGADGRLAELNVRPGDHVKAGDVLAALDTSELEQQVAQAELAYLTQQAVYSSTVQPDPQKVAAAQAALSSASAAYEAAEHKYTLGADQVKLSCSNVDNAEAAMLAARDAYETTTVDHRGWYYQEKQQRRLAYEFAQNAYDAEVAKCNQAKLAAEDDSGLRSAQAQLVSAKSKLDESTSPSSETVLAAQADLEQARLELEEARRQLENSRIVAPLDGVVLEVKASLGDSVAANAGLIVLADPSAVEIEATVIEEDYPLVQAGQLVELFFDVMPDAAVTGHVARVVPQRVEGDRLLYPVYIAVDDLPEGVLPDMTVDASIVIDKRENVLRLPRAVVRTRSDGTAQVQVWTGDRIEERTVKV
ncbi:MAG: efflux RND transporter periplasmic adaptor subunit, partial [Anaerolineae bacterium]